MRDLQKDLEKWITDHDIGAHGEWFYMTGEYIERAIKAEAEVERYKLMVKSITGGLDEAIETVHYLETENAQLRKVADAARALVPSEMYQCTRHLYALKHTLDEYDKAKEEQECWPKEFYDLTNLKEYVEKEKIMDKFTPEQRADIQAMADELSKVLQNEEGKEG